MKGPQRRGRVMTEINITPFTDVVLVLLIIFMIATPLLLQPGIKVKMPSAKAAETETDKPVQVTIDAQGKIYVDNKQVDIAGLKAEIALRVAGKPDLPVIVKGDKEVRYDIVIKVIDGAKQSGASRIALGVELRKD